MNLQDVQNAEKQTNKEKEILITIKIITFQNKKILIIVRIFLLLFTVFFKLYEQKKKIIFIHSLNVELSNLKIVRATNKQI
jgi:hypothetical protein